MDIYEQDFEVNEKSPNHPITKADIDSHLIIKESLENLLPGTHFFSEESQEISWEKRKSWISYWLVDPLDGTKEFIKKNREFTINIALINNFKPILGVVYAPCFSKIYFAAQGLGSFFQEIDIKENNFSILKKSKLMIDNKKVIKNNLKIISSRSHKNNEKLDKWLKSKKNYQMLYLGSSLKFCLIAEGKADIYPRFKPTSEWDTAAGHCILKEAGGNVRDLDDNEILYNNKESVINPEFIASRY